MVYWIWLTTISGIGVMLQRSLLDAFGNPQNIYWAQVKELQKVGGLGPIKAEKIVSSRNLDDAYRILQACDRNGIKIMTYHDSCYPSYAKRIAEMPVLLYYKGNARQHSIGSAIVGARRCGQESKAAAVALADKLARGGIPVISGMAKGIDSYAHTACLKAGGYTVSVQGCGLDICYPCEHISLMKKIEEQGLLISEYAPGTPPRSSNFPKRNRIIAAWSEQIYILGAGIRSGALITAEYGKKYGRKVTVLETGKLSERAEADYTKAIDNE